MGPIWGQQDPGGPHVCPMNFAIWEHAITWNSTLSQLTDAYTSIDIMDEITYQCVSNVNTLDTDFKSLFEI